MITRRARPRYRVAVEVTHAGGWRAWNAVGAAFEQRLAAQASPAVHEPRLESETRRGSDVVRVRIAMTVRAADPGQAAVIAWDVFKVAVGEDAAMWDLDAASAEIRPEGSRSWLRRFPALAISRCRGALGDPLVVVARGLGSVGGPLGAGRQRGNLVVARRVALTVISRQRGGPRSRHESERRISPRPGCVYRARDTPGPCG